MGHPDNGSGVQVSSACCHLGRCIPASPYALDKTRLNIQMDDTRVIIALPDR